MPEVFQEKVKYLCTIIPDVEWSGIMFYSVKGSIQDPENMVLIPEDILPLDRGSQAYTEYELDKRVDEYIGEDMETRIQWHIGHIHSHNTMAVFFSGTDMAELFENSEAHNIYFSLIVNNKLNYTAKVGMRAKVDQVVEDLPYFAADENGDQYEIGRGNVSITTERFYTYNCDIQAPEQVFNSEMWNFGKKVAQLFAPKAVKTYQPQNHWQGNKPAVQTPMNRPGVGNNANGFQKIHTPSAQSKMNFQKLIEEMDEEDFVPMAEPEFVIASTIKGALAIQGKENLFSILEDISEEDGIEHFIEEVISGINTNYLVYYENIVEDTTQETFVEHTDAVILMLEELAPHYTFLQKVVEFLKQMLFKIEENATTI